MTTLPTLTTARLTLTPLVVANADAMVVVYANEAMHTYTGGSVPSATELRERYERLAAGWNHDHTEQWCNWIVRLIGHPDPIGAMQATLAGNRTWAAVAWEVAVAYQGTGYASEAAEAVVNWLATMGVGRVSANIHPRHGASAAVARKAGMLATSKVEDGEVVWELPLRAF